jgi:hypothetical protein
MSGHMSNPTSARIEERERVILPHAITAPAATAQSKRRRESVDPQ